MVVPFKIHWSECWSNDNPDTASCSPYAGCLWLGASIISTWSKVLRAATHFATRCANTSIRHYSMWFTHATAIVCFVSIDMRQCTSAGQTAPSYDTMVLWSSESEPPLTSCTNCNTLHCWRMKTSDQNAANLDKQVTFCFQWSVIIYTIW